MLDAWSFATLSDAEYLSVMRRKSLELDAIDRETERLGLVTEFESEVRAWANGVDYHTWFRDHVHATAVAALAALGVKRAPVRWYRAVVETRIWVSRLGSERTQSPISVPRRWESFVPHRGVPQFDATSPIGEWWLWVFVLQDSQRVFADRRARKFGSTEFTAADLEESRLGLEIDNDIWAACRARAAWVLRDAPEGL